MLEHPFVRGLDTGGMRRVFFCGRENTLKRFLLHDAALNLGLLLRLGRGHGTPWCFRSASDRYFATHLAVLCGPLMFETHWILECLLLSAHDSDGFVDP